MLLVDSGQGAEVEKLLESIEREGVSFWPSAVVIARAWRGDLEGSLAGLEETVRPGGDFWPPLDSVLYAPLAAEPRFRALAGQVQADRDAEGARTRAEVVTMLERGEFVLPTAANAQLVD